MKNKFYEAWNVTHHRENSVHISDARYAELIPQETDLPTLGESKRSAK